ncbi:MAG: SDR family oxidoreductase [Nitrospinae bacterium]|nr:SDR family oxidoreductase [Nitrospinota bacterium]
MSKKTAIVTGGNRGIGLDITKAYVDAGYYVLVGARNSNDLEEKFKDQVKFVVADVRNESSHQKLVDAAVEATGSLDVYVNNAGVSEWRPINNIDDAFLDDLLATNLKSAFWGCKAATSAMQQGGTIINISSIAGKRGSSNNSAYCATKFGMNGLTQALAKEVGPKGIRVNALCPVLIPTKGLIDALKSPFSPASGDPEEFIANFKLANAALGRLPSGPEVGSMCLFLSSEGASAITGQCINVDCGVFPQ